MRGWSIADAPHGALARVNWLLRSSVSNEAAATVMRYAWGFPEKTIAGLLETRARREDAMYHEPSSMTEADRTIEALRQFALHAGAFLASRYAGFQGSLRGGERASLEGAFAAVKALDGGEPKPEPAHAEAAKLMGTLVSSVLDRATVAVRDEAGSQLCAWPHDVASVKRVCRQEMGFEDCLCRQVALAVIDVLKPKEA